MAAAVFAAFCLPAGASDLASHPDNKPVSLNGGAKRVQVVNVWAAWCVPCRREMPVLSQWYRQEQGRRRALPLQMVGVALDTPANITRFLRETPAAYPVWRYTGRDSTAWMREWGNPVGALPFTLVRVEGCTHRKALLGEVDARKLSQAVDEVRSRCR